MEFLSAEEIRKMMRAEKTSRALAVQKFKELKDRTLQNIIARAKEEETECMEFLLYPAGTDESFSRSIYREEFEKLARYFFRTYEYNIRFESATNNLARGWATLIINWGKEE